MVSFVSLVYSGVGEESVGGRKRWGKEASGAESVEGRKRGRQKARGQKTLVAESAEAENDPTINISVMQSIGLGC